MTNSIFRYLYFNLELILQANTAGWDLLSQSAASAFQHAAVDVVEIYRECLSGAPLVHTRFQVRQWIQIQILFLNNFF